ncbi:MAG: IS3 family transposase [Thermosipho sp. (in: Bacteria)]|nr:IS3 family transposase [Thermosipho sp. (in: thermotogales)]
MQVMNLQAITHKKHRYKRNDSKSKYYVENLLNQNFKANRPNDIWVSDITYIPTREKMMYLATVVDVMTRKIVGWAIDSHMREELVIRTMKQAIMRTKPHKRLIVHTDRGSQYTSQSFRTLLKEKGFIHSMNRVGNCYDNALMESVYGTIKKELVYPSDFQTAEKAITNTLRFTTIDKDYILLLDI